MTRPLYRTRNILAAVDAVRDRHHWARQPMRLKHIVNLLGEEQIRIVHTPMRERAFLFGADGQFVITMRRAMNGETRAKVLLHEYGHAQLHYPERGEVVRQLMPCTAGDPREAEADLFAALLWFGPTATPDHPVIAKLVAKLEHAVHMQHAPQQLPLEMAEARPDPVEGQGSRVEGHPFPPPHPADREPRFKHHVRIWDDLTLPIPVRRKAWLEFLALQPKRLYKAITHDEMLLDWKKSDGKPLHYFHLKHGWIEVYDGRRIETVNGKTKWQVIKTGDPEAERRTFVLSTDDRRRYDFKKRERRGWSPKELDAQIEKAVKMVGKRDVPLADPTASDSSKEEV